MTFKGSSKMTAYLLDINVLLSLAWPNHPHHAKSTTWFLDHEKKGWGTSLVTQMGFIRLSSHPQFTASHVSPEAATRLLEAYINRQTHVYFDEPHNGLFSEDFSQWIGKIHSHHFVTDGLLVYTAHCHEAKLATYDQALSRLFPANVHLLT